MNNIFVIGDTHFSHENIIKYCDRPYSSIEEMNENLVQNWNEVVGEEDTVIMVGDFALGKREEVIKYGQQLNGRKILVRGNHDRATDTLFTEAGFITVHKKPLALDFDGTKIIFSHAPLNPTEHINVHGHIHSSCIQEPGDELHYCVCVEAIGYKPIRLTELLIPAHKD